MKRTLATAVAGAALAVPLAVVTAGTASAAPQNAGAACVQAGIGFLKDQGLLVAAAKREIDYSTLANPSEGPIYTSLPEGSFLSLGQVVRLHVTDPELFAWC